MTIQTRTHRFSRVASWIGVLLVISGMGWGYYKYREVKHLQDDKSSNKIESKPAATRMIPQVLELSETMFKAMHLKTATAVVPRFSKVLHLRGSLAIDPNRLSHVHARFPGQIVELATVAGLKSQPYGSSTESARLLQNFDAVTEGMRLAVIQSKDLGEKKSQLADSLTKLRLEQKTLDKLEELFLKGGCSERQVREQEGKRDQAQIAVSTAENTLLAFQATEVEISQVKESVDKIHRGQEADKSYAKDWSRVVVNAPISGDIVEKSVIVGDIVDANDDLFKIADLSVLAVYLHPYEEDLQTIEQLPKPLQVWIKVPAYPELGELQCDVDRSSPMIDPNEHMALLIGKVKNSDHKLKANQFVTAEVGTPVEKGIVEIPANSVIDLGNEAIVYVQPDLTKPVFQRRRVDIVRRYFDVVYIRSELTSELEALNLQPVRAGESVVKGWILELEDYSQQQQQQ